MNNAPVYGCSGCDTTGGRASCPHHGSQAIGIVSPRVCSRVHEMCDEYIAKLEAERDEERARLKDVCYAATEVLRFSPDSDPWKAKLRAAIDAARGKNE